MTTPATAVMPAETKNRVRMTHAKSPPSIGPRNSRIVATADWLGPRGGSAWEPSPAAARDVGMRVARMTSEKARKIHRSWCAPCSRP